MRSLLLAAAACAAALATGCVSAGTRDVKHVERDLLREQYTGLAADLGVVRDGTAVVRLQQLFDRTYDQTTTVDRQVVYTHWSLAAASVQSQESRAGKALMIPVAVVAGAIDLVAWVITAPVAYPAGGVMGIDPAPERAEVIEERRFDCAEGQQVAVTIGEGDAAATRALAVTDGCLRIPLDTAAEPALASGRTRLRLAFALPADPRLTATAEIGLGPLMAIVESQVRGDLEERYFRWRRIRDAVPADAPGAAAVKAALQKKIAPLEQALR